MSLNARRSRGILKSLATKEASGPPVEGPPEDGSVTWRCVPPLVVVWCGVAWRGVVWCRVLWRGVAWCGVAWCAVCGGVRCGVAWRCVVWCGVVWCGAVLCCVAWRGMVGGRGQTDGSPPPEMSTSSGSAATRSIGNQEVMYRFEIAWWVCHIEWLHQALHQDVWCGMVWRGVM